MRESEREEEVRGREHFGFPVSTALWKFGLTTDHTITHVVMSREERILPTDIHAPGYTSPQYTRPGRPRRRTLDGKIVTRYAMRYMNMSQVPVHCASTDAIGPDPCLSAAIMIRLVVARPPTRALVARREHHSGLAVGGASGAMR